MTGILQMSDVHIKPCPFCGAIPDVDNPNTFQETDGPKWGAVVCCGTGPEVRTGYGPVEDWRDDAIDEWNKRADTNSAAHGSSTDSSAPDTVPDLEDSHD